MEERVKQYIKYLEQEEKSEATRRQYKRDILHFLSFAKGQELTRELALRYKEELQSKHRAGSVNVKLAALNGFFSYLGREDLRVKRLRIQKRPFLPREKELSKAEYLRLLEAARQKKNEKLRLLLETICGTGIRVSELKYITVEAVEQGEAAIRLKGKIRVVLISGKLRKALKEYLRRGKISSGPVFVTKNGNPLDRSNIWKMMKALCKDAGVARQKVFPHNLRHLFARCFYKIDKDIARLADILGHSSINTTRIYVMSSDHEPRKRMDALGLVI
ncbi:MAG TPA: tyrosine-type recombinase/integrase [Candidatus Mediterraneibacter intestinipullorum]|nr:tyrosine-type recombinase/integrase [Candidatus Mediterraneibacter intestinipullorum]